jgi:hypothetical protein
MLISCNHLGLQNSYGKPALDSRKSFRKDPTVYGVNGGMGLAQFGSNKVVYKLLYHQKKAGQSFNA